MKSGSQIMDTVGNSTQVAIISCWEKSKRIKIHNNVHACISSVWLILRLCYGPDQSWDAAAIVTVDTPTEQEFANE